MRNVDLPEWELAHDGNVQVQVRHRPGLDAPDTDVKLRLDEVWRLVESGEHILDVGGAAGCVGVVAVSVAYWGQWTYITAIRDFRGKGRLAGSQAPAVDGNVPTLGVWFQQRCERSGVPQVNERRKRAKTDLFREWGDDHGRAVIHNIRYVTIWEYFSSEAAGVTSGWILYRMPRFGAGGQGVVLAQSDAGPGTMPTIADRIERALSVEAFGAEESDSRKARDWRVRVEDDPEWEMEVISGRPQIMSDWTLQQGTHDPTGETATGLADRTALPEVAAFGLDPSSYAISRVTELTTYGVLTKTQARYLALAELGWSQRQIAECLGRDESTVSRTLRRARERLDKGAQS
ncbi:MAG: helix-turn-helix domain-containing protein [Nitrososphaerales archaeon]